MNQPDARRAKAGHHRPIWVTTMAGLEPVHPGEILKHDFMGPLGLSSTALAKAIRVSPARINEIVRGRRTITRSGAGQFRRPPAIYAAAPSRTARILLA
jgi:hypothetical protein